MSSDTKRPWYKPNLNTLLHAMGLGLLSWLGSHVIPFTTKAVKHWQEQDAHAKKQDDMLESINKVITARFKIEDRETETVQLQLKANTEKIEFVDKKTEANTASITAINQTIDYMQGNKKFKSQ